jgi:CheY-like chemotaxis protein
MPTVLVVDDDAHHLDFVLSALRRAGMELRASKAGATRFSAWRRAPSMRLSPTF